MAVDANTGSLGLIERPSSQTLTAQLQRMAWDSKMLGQVQGAAATDVTLYTIAATALIAGTVTLIQVCNVGAAALFRVHWRDTGQAVAVGNALYYDVPLAATGAANSSIPLILPIPPDGATLRPGGILSVRSDTGNVVFTAFGFELTRI